MYKPGFGVPLAGRVVSFVVGYRFSLGAGGGAGLFVSKVTQNGGAICER